MWQTGQNDGELLFFHTHEEDVFAGAAVETFFSFFLKITSSER